MFENTIDLTIDAVPLTHTRIDQTGYSGEFRLADEVVERRIKIRHTKTNPRNGVVYDRHNVEITETVFATTEEAEHTRKIYFVVEQKPGDIETDLGEALSAWMTPTNLAKLMNWES